MLYDNKAQLVDGVIIALIASYLCGKTNAIHTVAKSNQTSSANKLNFAIKCILDRFDIGTKVLPIKLNDPAIITKIIDGDSNTALLLVHVICSLAKGSKGSLDTDSIISRNLHYTKENRDIDGAVSSSSSRAIKPVPKPVSILKNSNSSRVGNSFNQGPFVHDPPTESSKPFVPSASFLRHSDCSLGSLISVATTNPMLIPNNTVDISNHLYVPRESRLKIIKWIERKGLGRMSANKMANREQFNHEAQVESVKSVVMLDNEFDNGVIMSELISFLINRHGTERGNKNAEKELVKCNSFGQREKPRYFLAGTETTVRSKAQAMRNMTLVLSAIKGHFELGFEALTSSADDLLTNDVLKWNILYKLYRTRKGLLSHVVPHNKVFKYYNKKGNNSNRSLSPPQKRSSSVGVATASRSSSRGRLTIPPRSKSVDRSVDYVSSSNNSNISGTIGTYRVHFNERYNAEQEIRGRSKFRESDQIKTFNTNRYEVNNFAVPFKSRSAEPTASALIGGGRGSRDLGSKSSPTGNSRSLSPQKEPSREKFNLSTKLSDDQLNSGVVNINNSFNSTANKTINVGAVAGRGAGKDTFLGPSNRYLKYGKREKDSWLPPKFDALEVEKARSVALPDILPAQQSSIRGWLLGLGLSILDGEGGFYNNQPSLKLVSSSTAPPLPLSDDKLRNGELLCDLAITLEPVACRHVHLARLVHRRPKSIAHCVENLERASWIFKMRKCPPLPYVYLCQPSEVVSCSRNVLWGLLWQLMQVYPPADDTFGSLNGGADFGLKHIASILSSKSKNRRYSNVGKVFPEDEVVFDGGKKSKAHESDHEYDSSGPESLWFLKLPYNPKQRRALDVSLVSWLDLIGVLKVIRGNEQALTLPATILELEGSVREGLLFCIIAQVYLNAPIKPWNKRPLTYGHCVSNVRKAMQSFLTLPNMSHRYLSHGVDEDIVRGDWDCVLGLLEDLRRCCDEIAPRQSVPSAADWRTEGSSGPYIGLPYNSAAKSAEGEQRRALSFEQLQSSNGRAGNEDQGADADNRFGNAFNSPQEKSATMSMLMSPDSIEKSNNPHSTFDDVDGDYGNGFDDLNAVSDSVAMGPINSPVDILPVAERRKNVPLEPISNPNPNPSVLYTVKVEEEENIASPAPIINTIDSIKLLKFKKSRDACYKWLCQLQLIPQLLDESHDYDFLNEFPDGILLCRLVCKLEKLVDNKWVVMHPKSSAQRLQNIRKALEIVSEKNKHIPLSALACEDGLLAGNKETCMSLLLALKRGYNF